MPADKPFFYLSYPGEWDYAQVAMKYGELTGREPTAYVKPNDECNFWMVGFATKNELKEWARQGGCHV